MVAGPTCSGKSALAMELARRFGGTVINADSMQVYRELPILTARPTPADEAAVPHALYGVRPAAEPGSAAWWHTAALDAMQRAAVPILCGGTGLYLRTLLTGIAAIPDPGDAARQEARDLVATGGAAALHARLAAADPVTAARLRPNDAQRVARAWEVWRGTGRGLAAWQADAVPPPSQQWEFTDILLDPPRPALRAAAAERFGAMLQQGAVAEAAALAEQRLDVSVPAMQAHGVPELLAYLRGETPLAEAERRAVLATWQYTKRQTTWFRHHRMADPDRLHTIHARFESVTQLSECLTSISDYILHRPG